MRVVLLTMVVVVLGGVKLVMLVLVINLVLVILVILTHVVLVFRAWVQVTRVLWCEQQSHSCGLSNQVRRCWEFRVLWYRVRGIL